MSLLLLFQAAVNQMNQLIIGSPTQLDTNESETYLDSNDVDIFL